MQTQLYRHFDADGKLLYVGISLSAAHRLSQHNGQSEWASKIASMTVETLASREEALAAERVAIKTEKPAWNKANTATAGRIHTSIYLHKRVLRELRAIAIEYDRKPHDILIEGVDMLLAHFARPSVEDLSEG